MTSKSVCRPFTSQAAFIPPNLDKTGNQSQGSLRNGKNTVTITNSDLQRIKDSIAKGESNLNLEQRQKERNELNEKSKARVKNWPNTLEAMRKKKDETRFLKFKAEEEERRKVDAIEAEEQARKRAEIIGMANRKIYEESDRVKAFQSKLLLSDAMQEREVQKEIERRKREYDKQIDAHFDNLMREKIKEDEEKEKLALEGERMKKKRVKEILRTQHDEMKEKYVKKMQQDKIEGEIMKKQATDAAEREKADEYRRFEKRKKLMSDIKNDNDLLKKYAEELKKKEREEDLKIEAFSKRKEEIAEMRKTREEQKQKEKMAQRQRLIDIQVEYLKNLKNTEEERLNNQVKEVEVKKHEEERKKLEKIEEQKRQIDRNNALTLKNKEIKRQEEINSAKDFQRTWMEKNEHIDDLEKKEKDFYRQKCKQLENVHLEQISDKQKFREKLLVEDLKSNERSRAMTEADDRIFNEWAKRQIEEYKAQGKNIKPLLLEFERYKRKVI